MKAIEETGESIAIASEGSFGPHPSIYFVPANIELLLFIDTLNNIEILGWEISTDTNFSQAIVSDVESASVFAKKGGFPSHAMVVRPNKEINKSSMLFKGITSGEILKDAVIKSINASIDGKALIETDMRAIYNPKRMKVIEKATVNLLNKILNVCPECSWPAFEITERVKGLPCESCFFPTRGIKKYIFQCKNCNYKLDKEFPDNQNFSDSRYCDICNP
ncbi:MAG: hypothetical protein M3R27_04540 [Bacteroidota bacterium]|nr:hypothetical protein [Bacteroidota bacterium]